MSKKLLREYYALCDGGVCQDLLTEEEKRYVADGGMILSGIMQMTETQNGNGRVYPHSTMMREAKEFNNNVFTKADKINRLLNEVLSEED